MQEKQLCPVCLRRGRKSYLKSFQVNLEEALWLCENKRCIYPLGQESDPTFNRKLDDLPSERDSSARIPAAQLALQMQVASRLTECHQKIQTDVIGIQTGSPLFMKTFSKRHALKQNGLNIKSTQNGLKTKLQNGAKDPTTLSFNTSNGMRSEGTGEGKFPGLCLGKNGVKPQLINGSTVETSHSKHGMNPGLMNNLLERKKTEINPSSGKTAVTDYQLPCGMPRGLESNGTHKTVDGCDDRAPTSHDKEWTNGNGTDLLAEPFIQWKNHDALCWLDVVLCLLVHNKSLKQLVDRDDGSLTNSLIYKLSMAHCQARALLLKQKVPSGNVTINGSNGDCSVNGSNGHNGNLNSSHTQRLSPQSLILSIGHTTVRDCSVSDSSSDERVKASEILNEVRDEIWSFVREKIQCEKGRPSSPVQALQALLQSDPTVERLFRSSYKFTYSCPHCKFLEDTDCESVLPSLPAVVKDFEITNPVHKKKCLNCSFTKGKRKMTYKILPESFMMHFLEGLPSNSWSSLEFTVEDVPYTVTGVIQYLRNPDHFVAWLRNPKDNTWILCDDLKSPICPIRVAPPRFSWKQVHIVMWEQAEKSSESSLPAFCERLHCMNVSRVDHKTDQATKAACTEWLNGLNKHVNAGTLINDFTPDVNTKLGQKIDNCIKQRNGGLNYGCDSRYTNSFKTSDSTSTELCSAIPKSSKCRAMLDLSYSSSESSASKQQISIDSLRFLKSSTTYTSSSLERSACSSISSTCSELSDNVSLPEFISTAHVADGLVKPIPCRNDSPVQNSEFLDRNVSEADPNCDYSLNTDKVCDTKITQKVELKTSSHDIKHTHIQSANTSFEQGTSQIPNIKPSSVFCTPLKSDKNKRDITKFKSESVVDSHKMSGGVRQSGCQTNKNGDLKAIGNNDQFDLTKVKKDSTLTNGSTAVVKELPEKSTEDRNNSFRFKLPGLLRKKTKPSKISRDAFKTLSRAVDKVNSGTVPPSSPTDKCQNGASLSPRISPITGSTAPYLTAVKQYLIDKTTDKSHFKTKFEGLNLKSAPHLGRSIDLSGLKRNDVDYSPEVKSSPASGLVSRNSKLSIVSDTLVKRRRQLIKNDSSAKRLKTEPDGSSDTTNILIASAAKLSACPENYDSGVDEADAKPPVVNMKMEPSDVNNYYDNTPVPSFTINKGNGEIFQSPQKMLNTADPETGSVLQDLYDALNIPFTSIKETMSDIMVDVDDILGSMDAKDLDTCQPYKTDSLHSALGNQAHLDCGLARMNRLVPQSPQMARQIWSLFTSLDKMLLLS